MTNDQKSTVLSLRANGEKYAAIAQAVGLSLNTVKSYCRRTSIAFASQKPVVKNGALYCKQCGTPLVNNCGSKPKQFCSDNCRNTWWKNNPDSENRKAYYSRICAHCGKRYTVYGRPNSKYCCHACSAQHRVKKAETEA